MARRRLSEMTGQTPMGDPRIPYDQTDPMQQMGAPPAPDPSQMGMPPEAVPPDAGGLGALAGAPPDASGGMPGPGLPGEAQPPDVTGPGISDPTVGLGGPPPGASTDQLTGDQLAALSGDPTGTMSPEDQQVQQMTAAMNDPNTPPDQVAQIQQMMDLAARRRLAGLGSQQGGLGA